MFLLSYNSKFKPVHQPNAMAKIGDFLFVYDGTNIGLANQSELPQLKDSLELGNFYCFGYIEHHQCLFWSTHRKLNFIDTKLSYKTLSKDFYQAVVIGNHIHHWRNSNKFCGKCASAMVDKSDEQAIICSNCNNVVYPTISPCVIVLVTHGEKMLLARSPHFRPGVMSTLAGFVEVGESAEQTLVREVQEEVGIQVDHIKYICSQPWPFPNSLMLGFTAKYVSGEIIVDKNEIENAGWFDKNNLPELPNEISIARYLIDLHLSQCSD